MLFGATLAASLPIMTTSSMSKGARFQIRIGCSHMGPSLASLHGCTSSEHGSACGPPVSVQQHLAQFGLVEPGWRGEVMANPEFRLVMQASWQDLPIVRQDIALRRGRPQAIDVLVSLTAITRKK